MKFFRIALLVGIAISVAPWAAAQEAREWLPRGIEALRQGASTKTEFRLDHPMLVIASKLDSDDDDLRRVIAGVDGLSFHTYHYPRPWMYDSRALREVKQEYRAAGWHQLVDKHGRDGSPGLTGLWVRSQHAAITNVAILVTGSREVTFILVSGSISPLDLLHISGHFGIPKIEGGVKVPNTRRPPEVPPPPPETEPAPEAPPRETAPAPGPEVSDTIVEITSTPDGADIELDGAYVGSTPSTITLSPGDHAIAIHKPGYAVWGRTLRITGGRVRVDAPLEPEAPADGPR